MIRYTNDTNDASWNLQSKGIHERYHSPDFSDSQTNPSFFHLINNIGQRVTIVKGYPSAVVTALFSKGFIKPRLSKISSFVYYSRIYTRGVESVASLPSDKSFLGFYILSEFELNSRSRPGRRVYLLGGG